MTESDLGPLTWVKGEIDLALSRAGEALARYAGSDREPLRLARNHLHQAHGALTIVGLEGVSVLTEAMERLLDALEEGKADANSPAVLGAALAGVRHYLDGLMEGEPDQPLRLYEHYRALQAARGEAEAEATAADLFFPDLSLRPPRREGEPLPASTAAARIKAARLGYERGLLKWLKGNGKGAVEMRNSLAVIERTQTTPAARALWWAGMAMIDAIVVQAVPVDAWLKKLLGRIGRQAGKLADGLLSVPDRLLRDVLYVVAEAGPAAGEHAACVRAAWKLDALIPAQKNQTDLAPFEPRLRAMRGQLEKTMEDWNRFSAGTAAALPAFHDQVVAMVRQGEQLGHDEIRRLLRGIVEIGDALRRDPLRLDDTLALEMATALLLLEHALTDFARLSDDFAHQVGVVLDRLAAWSAGRPLVNLESPHLDELSQRAQEKLLMAQVSREILASLSVIEQTLDTYFRDPGKGLVYADLEKPLRQVGGALIILGEMRAREILDEATADIQRLAAPNYEPVAADFEALASKLSVLGLFVERLQYGPADIDAILAPKPAVSRLTVGEEIEASQTAGAAPLPSEIPVSPASSASPVAPPETVAASVGPVPAPEVPPVELPAVEPPPLPPAEPETGLAMATKTAAPAEVSPAGTAAQASTATAIDAELLEIFIEEGGEVLGTLSAQIPQLHASPHDRETLTTVRRAFHTLKGSGRMVGLDALGEAAWAVEQTLNQWLQREMAVDAALLTMLDQALTLFGHWIDQLRASGSGKLDASTLIEYCAALRERRTPALAAVAAATPEAATEAPAATAEPESASPEPVPTPAPTPEVVLVGELEISPTLYRLYLDEADVHLAMLRCEIGHEGVPTQELIRAAHTLAGISATSGFRAVHQLAHVLEGALVRFATTHAQPDEAQRLLLARASGALEGMIGAIAARRLPAHEEELVAELERLRPALELVTPVAPRAEAPAPVEEAVHPVAEPAGEAAVAEAAATAAVAVGLEEVADELAAFELPPLELPELVVHPEAGERESGEEIGAFELPALELPDFALPPLERGEAGEAEAKAGAVEEAPVSEERTSESPAGKRSVATGDAAAGPAALDLSPLELAQELEEIAQSSIIAPLPPAEEEYGPFAEPALELTLDLEEPGGPVAPVTRQEAAPEPLGPIDAMAVERPTRQRGEKSQTRAPAAFAPEAPPAAPAGPAGEVLAAVPVGFEDAKVSPIGTPPPGSLAAGEFPVAGVPQETIAGIEELPDAERRQSRLHDDLDLQLLPIFLEESEELMQSIGEELRRWHGAPEDGAIAAQMKRLLHTLKGGARMAGAMAVGELIHAMESRIEQALALKAVTPAFLDDFDTSFDRVAMLIETLRRIAAGETAAVEEAPAGAATSAEPAAAAALTEATAPESETSTRALLRVRADQVDRLVNEAGEMAIARARIEGEMRTLKASLLDLTENVIRLRSQLREIDIQAEMQMTSREMMVPEGRREFDPLEFDRFTRFQELTRMMAESVGDVATIQQNLLANLDRADAALVAQARLNRELSQALMSIRMVPLSSLAERLHRIVRQTAKEMGKRANLDIRGGQTDLDRSVLEHITGPLEHLLRNAIAHGLEPAEVRKAAGKGEIGEIVLAAAQEGNEMVITLRDDGAGLNLARIRDKAIAQGLLGADEAVDDRTVIGFIFQSGFSTASEVSAVAGRGVGMDVVKTEVSALGGRIEVETQAGQGTTFRIWLPLTLVVTQALLIKVANKTYAIPSAMVEQASEMKPEVIARVRDEGAAEWLGQRYPWHYLPRLLGEKGAEPTPARRHWLLLLKGGQQSIALEVDGLAGNEEIVVKNIGPQLARVPGIAGATVLPNGEIVLIINPIALAARARALEEAGQLAALVTEEEKAPATTPVVLVVDDSLTVRKITGRLLAREGYEVVTAKDGQDAVEKMADFVPNVILSDIEMPRMDGFELARHVRNDERLRHVPIIMITSRTADKHKGVARDLGVDHYLGKPYDEGELLRLVAEFSSRTRDDGR